MFGVRRPMCASKRAVAAAVSAASGSGAARQPVLPCLASSISCHSRDPRAISRIWSNNPFGLPEETAGSITAFAMCSSVPSRSPENNRVIPILSAIDCGFLPPNSRWAKNHGPATPHPAE
jgi:hypothetical protein